ncbi:high mobility group protein D-like isoform X1 [Drosophila mauritiana]|uniref:High mobility group protein D-like isoform X1 n=2 Tax=Drosophila mauritiana TaxID=7226 RepID=A0A6P8L6Z2_DROMA|nr:high mobility group protein D-like isoform X1 [Drosophila mauritiana]
MPHCGPRPKKPVNAFLMWINSAGRNFIRAMHPGISPQEVLMKGSEMWGAMVDEEKVVWQEAARTAMADYKNKLEKWNTHKEQSEKTTQTDETVDRSA